MKPGLVTSHSFALTTPTNISTLLHSKLAQKVPIWHRNTSHPFLTSAIPISPIHKPSRRFLTRRYSNALNSSDSNRHWTTNPIEETLNADRVVESNKAQENGWRVDVGAPKVPSYVPAAKLSLSDQAFFLLAFIACTTSVAFTSLVIAAVPTLFAMGRAAISLSKLADTAREELPSTMAAIRLSGMEISDLTLELSDLSQEIADGVNKSAQAVQAAEAGIRQIGSLARRQTMSIIQERANLPVISLQPVVAGAAQKTSRAVGQATKTFMNMISRRELTSDNGNEKIDRIEI